MPESTKASSSQNIQIYLNSSKDYVRTTDEQKLELIDLVIQEKYSMKLASEIVGVKLSTVKYIVKAYKTDKLCFMEKLKSSQPKQKIEKKRPKLNEVSPQVSASADSASEEKSLSKKDEHISAQNSLINRRIGGDGDQKDMNFQMSLQQIQFWNSYFAVNNFWLYRNFINFFP